MDVHIIPVSIVVQCLRNRGDTLFEVIKISLMTRFLFFYTASADDRLGLFLICQGILIRPTSRVPSFRSVRQGLAGGPQ